MAIYGMKDASNMILFDKKTGRPAMFINYANATSSEWSAEAVYATKKGTKAIRWDAAREGVLTVETELFSLELLALVMGSDVENGTSGVIQRKPITLDSTRQFNLGEGKNIVGSSVSVVPVDADYVDHIGQPLQNRTSDISKVPAITNNVVVTAIDKSAKITWATSKLADSYDVFRNDEKVGNVEATSFTDSGLDPETEYTYVIKAVNTIGVSAPSAQVKATTAAEGTSTGKPVRATEEDIEKALAVEGKLHDVGEGLATFTFEDGKVVFDKNAFPGEHYAIYFEEMVPGVRKLTIAADKFPGNYGIIADAQIREQETGIDNLVQMHFKNAKPQPNFTLTQSSTEPTSLSITFDLFPDNENILADMKVID